MADPKNRLLRIGDWALDVPIPNPGLQAWLNSPQAKAALENVAQEVYRTYYNTLPKRSRRKSRKGDPPPGTLKRGAFHGVGQRTYPGQTQRYYAWVGNRALSYRKTMGKPYPRFIEYGKANPDGTRTRAGYHLRRAAAMAAKSRGFDEAAMSLLGGDSGAGTDYGQARPARKRLNDEQRAKLRALAGGDPAVKARRDAARRAAAARSRENMRLAGQRRQAEIDAKKKANPKPDSPK